jgi:hypothetical protein
MLAALFTRSPNPAFAMSPSPTSSPRAPRPRFRAAFLVFMACAVSLIVPALACVAWLTSAPARAQAGAAPAAAVAEFTEVTAALLGLEFDAAQRAAIRQHLDVYWQRGDHAQIEGVRRSQELAAQLRRQPPELAAVALRMTRPDALLGLQRERDRGDALAALLLAAHERAHPPLAPGRPGGLPLTRDSVDGQLALQHFMARHVHGADVPAPDRALREAAYRRAAALHPRLGAAEQVQVARAAGEAARLQYGWQRASPMDRLLGRAELGARLSAQEQAQLQQYLGGVQASLQSMAAQHRSSLLGSALASIRENGDTIMGRGTAWNPSTQRWEQQGGIVTEYNGTVRVP